MFQLLNWKVAFEVWRELFSEKIFCQTIGPELRPKPTMVSFEWGKQPKPRSQIEQARQSDQYIKSKQVRSQQFFPVPEIPLLEIQIMTEFVLDYPFFRLGRQSSMDENSDSRQANRSS